MRRVWTWLAVAAIALPSVAQAQEEAFCTEGENCIPDTLGIAFGTKDGSNEAEAASGDSLVAIVVSQTDTDKVQGWSYGFSIDPAVLAIGDNPCETQGDEFLCGTDANTARIAPSFNVSTAVESDGESPVGFISAVVLSFVAPAQLVQGQLNSLASVPVNVIAAPGGGSQIKFEDGALRTAPSPAVAINITVEGTAKLPATLVHGVVKGGCTPSDEICDDGIDNDCDGLTDGDDVEDCPVDPCAGKEGPESIADGNCADGCDNDGDGLEDAADPDCIPDLGDWGLALAMDGDVPVVNMTNAENALAFQLGISTAGGMLTLSSDLGADNTRLVEILITDNAGGSHDESNGLAVGDAIAFADEITNVERGTAIAGFAKGDFFAFDLSPGTGGPGLTVGYVADLDGNVDQIPASGKGVNQVLRLTGDEPEVEFSRGDADGNGKINVTDAVHIIQVVLGNLDAVYDCRDVLDANDDGSANITDAIPVLRWIFQRGDRLPEPFLACGLDATDDDLGCNETSAACAR